MLDDWADEFVYEMVLKHQPANDLQATYKSGVINSTWRNMPWWEAQADPVRYAQAAAEMRELAAIALGRDPRFAGLDRPAR